MEKTKKEVGKKSSENKGDYLTRLVLIQCVVCSVIFLGIFGLCKANTEMYNQLKLSFNNLMKNSMSSQDVLSKLKTVGEMVFLPMEESTTKETTEKITEATTEATTKKTEVQTVSFSADDLLNKIISPVEGEWTSLFGGRTHPISGESSFHSGLDIAAAEGVNIKAVLDGRVKKASEDSANGKFIVLEHGNVTTTYCHCSVLLVEENMVVRQGETIALVGSTGNSTGPHLHFEIKLDSELVNPATVLKRNEA